MLPRSHVNQQRRPPPKQKKQGQVDEPSRRHHSHHHIPHHHKPPHRPPHRPGRLSIAVCFVGQFLRHGALQHSITHKLGPHTYTAFLSSSTRHEETNSKELVDEAAECSKLIKLGFTSCVPDFTEYNASVYYEKT